MQLRPARDRFPVRRRDDHRRQPCVYNTAAKEIAAQHGRRSPSWPSTTSGRATPATSTCPCGARTARGRFWDGGERTPLYDHFVAGVLATTRLHPALCAEHQLLQRFAAGSFAPTGRLGPGQPHLRRSAGRARHRGPDGEPCSRRDVNPYLALAGMLAGGCTDRERASAGGRAGRQRLDSGEPSAAHTAGGPGPVRGSEIARASFGDDVVDHYVNMAASSSRPLRPRHRLGAPARFRADVSATDAGAPR